MMSEIHEVFSVAKAEDGALIVDLDFTGTSSGERFRAEYVLRENDDIGSAPMITQWIADNNPKILPYVPSLPLTLEELCALMPEITKRQLRLALIRNGISLAQVEAGIAAMQEGLEKQVVEIEWQDASTFNRLHPTLLIVVTALNLIPEHVDAMWIEATTI